MKNLTFKAYRQPSTGKDQSPRDKDTDPQKASYLKRREQVRKAQRTHRERKEAYVKSLETEVLQLRTNEAKIMQETKNLYARINQLERKLAENGIEASPAHFDQGAFPSVEDDSPSTNAVFSVRRNGKLDQIYVGESASPDDFILSEGSSSAPNGRWNFGGLFGKKDRLGSDRSTPQAQVSIPTTSPIGTVEQPSTASTNVIELDLTTIGTEFVLTLEAPCLGHTQGNPKEPHAPTGHALTATAPLLFQAPSTSAAKLPTSTWEAPSLGLERLLDLSTNLVLDDEVTPVQAWNYVRQHEAFSQIDVKLLRKLTQNLLAEVKCHGFGAVIEQGILENAVFDTFIVGKDF